MNVQVRDIEAIPHIAIFVEFRGAQSGIEGRATSKTLAGPQIRTSIDIARGQADTELDKAMICYFRLVLLFVLFLALFLLLRILLRNEAGGKQKCEECED